MTDDLTAAVARLRDEDNAPDADDQCEVLYWQFKARSDPTQTQTPLSERDAFKRTVRPLLLAATYVINKELRGTAERLAREIAALRAFYGDQHIRDRLADAERVETENEVLRAIVRAADAMRTHARPCRCHTCGRPECDDPRAYDAARAAWKGEV